MAKYLENLGASAPDNLFAGADIPAHGGSVTIAAGQGALKRGTVIALNTDNKGVILSATTGLKPYGILTDAVDATAETVAEIYLTGRFNKHALHVATGYTMTADNLLALRNGGIFVENSAE